MFSPRSQTTEAFLALPAVAVILFRGPLGQTVSLEEEIALSARTSIGTLETEGKRGPKHEVRPESSARATFACYRTAGERLPLPGVQARTLRAPSPLDADHKTVKSPVISRSTRTDITIMSRQPNPPLPELRP